MPSLTVKHNTLTLEDITTDDAGHTRNSSNTSTKSQTSVGYSSQSSQQAHSRQSSEDSSHNRNPSAGSSDTGIFGSMEKNKGRRVDRGGRVDPEEVINELMEDIQLDNMAVQEGKAVKTVDIHISHSLLPRLWRVTTVPGTRRQCEVRPAQHSRH